MRASFLINDDHRIPVKRLQNRLQNPMKKPGRIARAGRSKTGNLFIYL
jgi:hypothetical protein